MSKEQYTEVHNGNFPVEYRRKKYMLFINYQNTDTDKTPNPGNYYAALYEYSTRIAYTYNLAPADKEAYIQATLLDYPHCITNDLTD